MKNDGMAKVIVSFPIKNGDFNSDVNVGKVT